MGASPFGAYGRMMEAGDKIAALGRSAVELLDGEGGRGGLEMVARLLEGSAEKLSLLYREAGARNGNQIQQEVIHDVQRAMDYWKRTEKGVNAIYDSPDSVVSGSPKASFEQMVDAFSKESRRAEGQEDEPSNVQNVRRDLDEVVHLVRDELLPATSNLPKSVAGVEFGRRATNVLNTVSDRNSLQDPSYAIKAIRSLRDDMQAALESARKIDKIAPRTAAPLYTVADRVNNRERDIRSNNKEQ